MEKLQNVYFNMQLVEEMIERFEISQKNSQKSDISKGFEVDDNCTFW